MKNQTSEKTSPGTSAPGEVFYISEKKRREGYAELSQKDYDKGKFLLEVMRNVKTDFCKL